jgi:hypothetical protein
VSRSDSRGLEEISSGRQSQNARSECKVSSLGGNVGTCVDGEVRNATSKLTLLVREWWKVLVFHKMIGGRSGGFLLDRILF